MFHLWDTLTHITNNTCNIYSCSTLTNRTNNTDLLRPHSASTHRIKKTGLLCSHSTSIHRAKKDKTYFVHTVSRPTEHTRRTELLSRNTSSHRTRQTDFVHTMPTQNKQDWTTSFTHCLDPQNNKTGRTTSFTQYLDPQNKTELLLSHNTSTHRTTRLARFIQVVPELKEHTTHACSPPAYLKPQTRHVYFFHMVLEPLKQNIHVKPWPIEQTTHACSIQVIPQPTKLQQIYKDCTEHKAPTRRRWCSGLGHGALSIVDRKVSCSWMLTRLLCILCKIQQIPLIRNSVMIKLAYKKWKNPLSWDFVLSLKHLRFITKAPRT